MAYGHYLEQGRTPEEIDDMDICAYLRIILWRGKQRAEKKEPEEKYVEDFI